MEPLDAACSGAPRHDLGVLFQDFQCWVHLSGMFVPWDAGFIILYKLYYKLCQCKHSIVLYVVRLAFKKKNKSVFRSVGKGNKEPESAVESEWAEGHFLPSYPLNCEVCLSVASLGLCPIAELCVFPQD